MMAETQTHQGTQQHTPEPQPASQLTRPKIELVIYYKRSTTNYHIYYHFDHEGPPIAYYVPRRWFPPESQEYALKSAKHKQTKPPVSVMTWIITIPNPHN